MVVFGAWAIGGGYWGSTRDEAAIEALRRGLDRGMSAIDTAPIYGLGHSERLVARAVEGRRDEVVLMTKVGLRWDSEEGELFFGGRDEDGSAFRVYRNSRPASIRLEVERSLERLATDRLDLVQIHWHDPTTPIADSMGALAELVGEGKVRAVGVSNYDATQMEEAQRALGEVPLASTQPKYNLVAREPERELLPWSLEHEVGVVCYSPIEQGLLTGKVGPERTFEEGEGRTQRTTFSQENRARVNEVLQRVVAPIAAAHESTLAQTVIAWTIARPGVTAAIVGARSPEQVEENAAAGDLVLEPQEWRAIDVAFAELELVER